MKIVLTGATGYIGGRLLRKLLAEGNEVYCIIRSKSNTNSIPEKAIVCKYEGKRDLYGIMEKIKPDVLIHLAGLFLPEHDEEKIEELLDSNVVFSSVLFDATNKCGCKRLINTTSYWRCFEGREYNPVNLYAATKKASEDIARYYVEAFNWHIINLMLFDVYGEDDPRSKLLNLVHRMKEGESIDLTGGEQKLYFCYIDDVVSAFYHALSMVMKDDNHLFEEYAVRSDNAYPLREIIETYISVSGKHVKLNWGARPYRTREFMNPEEVGIILDGWTAKYDLGEGLKRYLGKFEK